MPATGDAPTTSSPSSSAPARPVPAAGAGLGWVFTAIFGVFGWAVGLAKLSDNSFFWHLKTGGYILDHGIPHHDVFSYTAPGTKWIAQSWLAEVAYALIDRSVGANGIRIFVGLIGAGIGVLSYRLALSLCRDRLVACGITAAALAGIYTVWSERPLLIGVLFLLVLLWLVEVPDSFVGRHPLVVIPLLMWCWANTHGTFELGFAYLALHVIGRWVEGHPPWAGRERSIVTGSLVGFAVIFVNPYGPGLLLFPLELLGRGDILSHVVEWQSPDFRKTWGMALGLWIVVYLVALARGRHRATRRDLIVTVPMLLLALWAVRNVAVAPLVGLPVVARCFARDEEKGSTVGRPLVAGAIAVLLFAALLMGFEVTRESPYDLATYPTAAMRYVERNDLLGTRLLTTDATAGWVILDHSPEQKVFMDDRYDMYPTSVIHDYFELTSGKPGWAKVLDRYRVETIVWPEESALGSLLDASDRWERVYSKGADGVWVRSPG